MADFRDDLDLDLEAAETQASDLQEGRRTALDEDSSDSDTIDQEIARHPTHVSRRETQNLQHLHTVGSTRPFALHKSVSLKFGGGRPFPPLIHEAREAYVVDFDGPGDPMHPFNWRLRDKVITAAITGFATFCSTFASSVFSTNTRAVAQHFHVGTEVSVLASSLYLCGYGVGPSIFAPMSELKGRKLPYLIGVFGFSVFATASATCKDIQTLMISRFFMAVFGSAPVALTASVYADMFDKEARGTALTVFATLIFLGPMIAPFIGGFTVTSYLGWRFNGYWSMIMGFTTLIAMALFMKETYPPTILVHKAELFRRSTKNWAIHAKQEEIEINIMELLSKNLSRPMRMFFTEPIVAAITIYLSFVYGLLYTFLTAYPIVFQGVHGMNPGVGGLPFFGMATGMILAGVGSILQQPAWIRKLKKNNGKVVPEWRLPYAALGGVVFTIGLFWFGWTGNYRSVHWIVPTLSGLFTGFGILAIFMQGFMYLVDAYLMFSASAIAANTIFRSLFAAACPLFARQMFDAMGINWAASLLGFVSLALVPVPLILLKYGYKIRQKSKLAPTPGPPPRKEAQEGKEETAT